MRGEENTQEDKKTYHYRRCSNSSCGIKLHTESNKCWKCGAKIAENNYISSKPEDAIYEIPLNNADKCMQCYNVQNGLKVCEPIFCFGTGRGKCNECKILQPIRYECCIETQKTDGVPSQEDIKKLLGGMFLRKQ